jgi:hypothetical protein
MVSDGYSTCNQFSELNNDTVSETVRITEWGATCTERILPITLERTTSQNFTYDSYGHDVFFALIDREILMTGTYNISTRTCVPEGGARSNSIQVLAHGATYTKNMWEFPYQPTNYSWVRHMNLAGYATFSFDFLGTRPHHYSMTM